MLRFLIKTPKSHKLFKEEVFISKAWCDFKIMISVGKVLIMTTQYHLTPIRMAVIANKNKN